MKKIAILLACILIPAALFAQVSASTFAEGSWIWKIDRENVEATYGRPMHSGPSEVVYEVEKGAVISVLAFLFDFSGIVESVVVVYEAGYGMGLFTFISNGYYTEKWEGKAQRLEALSPGGDLIYSLQAVQDGTERVIFTAEKAKIKGMGRL